MERPIEEIFPEVNEIESDEIRDVVIESWEIVREESPNDSITNILWAPHFIDKVGEQNFVRHLRSVTQLAIDITETITSSRNCDINRDYVIAGSLLHDISKPFEHIGNSHTELRDLLIHPHFGIYVLEKAEAPLEVQHIAISHTPRSSVPPKTIESIIVMYADDLDTFAIYSESTGSIPESHPSK